MQNNLHGDNKNIVRHQVAPPTQDRINWSQVKIGALPQKYKRSDKIADGEDVDMIGASQKDNCQCDPETAQKYGTLQNVQPILLNRYEIMCLQRYFARAQIIDFVYDGFIAAARELGIFVLLFDAEHKHLTARTHQQQKVQHKSTGMITKRWSW